MADVKGIASVVVAKIDPCSKQNSACIGTSDPSSSDFLPPSSAARPLTSAETSAPPSPPSPPVASFLLPPGPKIFHRNVTMQSNAKIKYVRTNE